MSGRGRAILVAGETCWRVERAERLSLIVDAADYFRTLKQAMLQARNTILLIGWDFDTRVEFEPDEHTLEGPNRLGDFLNWLVAGKPDLNVYLLKWNVGVLSTLGRGTTPMFILDWITNKRIHFRLDRNHPVGAAHHQKIAVIDDALAFCGGIDITDERWDTREHRDEEPARRHPRGGTFGPWHDATTAVDGAAARALGDLSRHRWKLATGEDIPVVENVSGDPWPEGLVPSLTDVEVGICRTLPPMEEQKGVHEIEALYLAAIASARRTIYLESQYFAAREIAEALARRLREPKGPEVVLINPESADGWLEEATMDNARQVLFQVVREADRHDRFRLYHPVTAKGTPIYVHAKIMVIDDRLLRVGSSNLNNRSMGFDSECDLAVEARGKGAKAVAAAITAIRDDLVGEHLGVSAADVGKTIEREGSLIGAIDALNRKGRGLKAFAPPEAGPVEELLGENDLSNPERPPRFWRRLRRGVTLR